MQISPYQNHKDSGVEWLGDVPAHWEVQWLKTSVVNVVYQASHNRCVHWRKSKLIFWHWRRKQKGYWE